MIFLCACQLMLIAVTLCAYSAGVVIGAPQPAVATPVTLTMAQTPQQYQQQQHAHQQAAQENEQFALAWLRATFEPATGCRIEQAELYKQYLTACAKIGRRGVIAPLHFPRCVRYVLCRRRLVYLSGHGYILLCFVNCICKAFLKLLRNVRLCMKCICVL